MQNIQVKSTARPLNVVPIFNGTLLLRWNESTYVKWIYKQKAIKVFGYILLFTHIWQVLVQCGLYGKEKQKYPLLDNHKDNTGDVITFETKYCRPLNGNQLVVFNLPDVIR